MNKYTKLALGLLIGLFSIDSVMADATYYLVRHAEKQQDGTNNPHLTEQGHERAKLLAKQLKAAEITKIYSSDYHRTLETAEPLAQALGVDVVLYDPSALKPFAQSLKQETGTILIVGHSNTTPPLATLLSGKDVDPIADNEYDNLYQIVLIGEQSKLTRFKIFPVADTQVDSDSNPKQ